MKFFSILTLLLGVALFAGGCHKAEVKPPEQPTPPPQTQVTPPPTTPTTPTPPETQTQPGEIAKVTPPNTEQVVPGVTFSDIHFDFDKYVIKAGDKATIKTVVDWLTKDPENKVRIEGNCDARGTSEYNVALGDKRAAAARDYMVAMGINTNRIETVSYGKDKPLCTESTESCYAKNRRDHFVILIGTAPK